MAVATQIPPRSEIPKEETWNAEAVFASVEDWQTTFEATIKDVPQLKTFEGKLGSSPDVLAEFWELSSQVRRKIMKLYFYASMNNAVDGGNETWKGLQSQIFGLIAQYSQAIAFEDPELLSVGQETLMDWINTHDSVQIYGQVIDNLFRQQKFVRSAEVEEVLGIVSDPFNAADEITQELARSEMVFEDAVGSDGTTMPVTQTNIESTKEHPNREVRRRAWNSYADGYLKLKNTLTAGYVANVKQNIAVARVRGYDSVLHMTLFTPNVPVDVFHTLIETYEKNLPIWHRYWDVRRSALKFEKIHPYDIWAPLSKNVQKIPFEQAINWICAGLAPLGSDYVETVRKGCLEDRWVDRAVNQGKQEGAFSFGTYDTDPSIMMSYNDSLGAMSTLAHEIGHSMHSYLSKQNQPEIYANYSLFVAEVASNFNQAMTRAYLFETKKDDRDLQLALIQEAMDNFHRYFFIMPTLARFEHEVYERVAAGKPVTAESINSLMSDLFAEGYGDTMTFDRERTGITWAQFPHLFRPYYTFQYATGISAAHALADKVLSGEASAVENYLQFLSAGSSAYSLDVLNLAGVDMLSPEPVERAFGVLEGLVDRLESLIS